MAVVFKSSLNGSNASGAPSIGDQLGQAVETGLLGAVGMGAAGRQSTASMFKYNQNTRPQGADVRFPSNPGTDWRVRVSLAPRAQYFNNSALLSPLMTQLGGTQTGGAIGGLFGQGPTLSVIFPYTPQLTIQHTANYSSQKLTHSNYAQHYYDNSEIQTITLTADFTVQNMSEGQYLLASVYFFRTVTKMFFGADPGAGNPPPLVYLNGYGQYYLPNVPCVVTNFSHTMPQDCDYIDVVEPGLINPNLGFPRLNTTRMPTTSSMTVSLQPVYSRRAQSTGFSLEDFARGALVNPRGAAEPSSSFGASAVGRYTNNSTKNGGFI